MLGAAIAALAGGGWAIYKWKSKPDVPDTSARTSGHYSPVIQGGLSINVESKSVRAFSLGNVTDIPPTYWAHFRWSFSREEYVNPRIVEDLIGWLSDPGSAIVAIDLNLGQNSNRYHAEFGVVTLNDEKWIHYEADEESMRPAFFRYKYIATSPSGIHILHCLQGGGGTGVFGWVALLALQSDTALVGSEEDMIVKDRILLKIIGIIGLGDRYAGKIEYQRGVLLIGEDVGTMPDKNREQSFSVHID